LIQQTVRRTDGNELEIYPFNNEESLQFEIDFKQLQMPICNIPLNLKDLDLAKSVNLVDRYEIEQIWVEHKELYRLIAQAYKCKTGKLYGCGFRMQKLDYADAGITDAYRVIVGLVFLDYLSTQFKVQTGTCKGWPDLPTDVTPILLMPGYWFRLNTHTKFQTIGVIFQ